MIIFDVWDDKDFRLGRVLLREDGHWQRMPISKGPRVYGNVELLPLLGTWTKFNEELMPGVHPVDTGLILTDSESKVATNVFYGFFPAKKNRSGMGRHGVKPVRLKFQIAQESPIANLSPEDKIVLAMSTAYMSFNWQGVEEKVKEIFLPPGVFLFAAFAALNIVKHPTRHFYLVKVAIAKFGFWYQIFDFCQRLGTFFDQVNQAESLGKLRAAGLEFADILHGLARDLGLAAVTALYEAYTGKKGVPQEPEQIKVPTARTKIKSTDPKPPEGCQHWQSAYKEWISKTEELLGQATEHLKKGDVKSYEDAMARAAQMRMQAHLLQTFIIETVHHIESMARLADPATKLMKNLLAAARKGSFKVALAEMKQVMKQHCRESGTEIKLTELEMETVAERVHKEAANAEEFGRYDWSQHDCDICKIGKFNAVVAEAMKKPLKIPRDWTMDDFELAAQGINPKTKKPFSDKEIKELFASDYQHLMNLYRDHTKMLEMMRDTFKGIDDHRQSAHHRPKNIHELMENGHDTGQAMLQWRGYRNKALEWWEALRLLYKDVPHHEKMGWVKLGMASALKLQKTFDVVDPVRTVGPTLLQKYGQTEMLKNMNVEVQYVR